jgi:SAM-dependent methyltransferase
LAAGPHEDGDDVLTSLNEEIRLAGSGRGRWHAEYVGLAYRWAVEAAMRRVGRDSPRVLKTDLWNECLAGERDIVNHLLKAARCRPVAVDVAFSLCVRGRSMTPGVHVVQADVRALPFRARAFDAVLDLSTLDHLPEAEAAAAVGEYGRVLRVDGVLLLVFWQRNVLVRLKLLLKRWLGRREKPGQQYFRRADIRSGFGHGLEIVKEFAAGSLLTLPHRMTGAVLGRVPSRVLNPVLGWLVRVGHAPAARGVLAQIAGLYGIIAVRHDG